MPNRQLLHTFGRNPRHVHYIIHSRFIAWRIIEHCPCSIYLEGSLNRLLILPYPPCAVKLSMVQPKRRIIRGIVDLTVRTLAPSRGIWRKEK